MGRGAFATKSKIEFCFFGGSFEFEKKIWENPGLLARSDLPSFEFLKFFKDSNTRKVMWAICKNTDIRMVTRFWNIFQSRFVFGTDFGTFFQNSIGYQIYYIITTFLLNLKITGFPNRRNKSRVGRLNDEK